MNIIWLIHRGLDKRLYFLKVRPIKQSCFYIVPSQKRITELWVSQNVSKSTVVDSYELFRADLWGCEPLMKSPTAWPPVSYSGPSRTAWASVLRGYL